MQNLFTLCLNRNTEWQMEHYHFHNMCEVLFVVEGGCECLIGTELYRLRRGTVLPLDPTTLHKTNRSGDGEYARYVLHFSPEDVAAFSTPKTDLLRCFQGKDRYIQLEEDAVAEMIKTFERCLCPYSGFGADVRGRNAFFELLIELGELSKIGRSPNRVDSKNFTRIQPILTYINENMTEQLSLETIAKKFHFNKQYFCRIFKKTIGISLGEYITSVRIQNSCLLLRRGCSVQVSGEESGFINNAAFITTFKKIVGQTPGKYKQAFKDARLIDEEINTSNQSRKSAL
ncbi:AraC family transcriptional regulator [Synergistaceae bacterium OttesenSCG-928-D05]|nr:AraC family transcriptional regulator [Synergistaceae bacterium OttesenSCG-928-D05]